jgi:uncharacterized protein
MQTSVSPSRYNFAARGSGGAVALFNTFTGSVIRLDGEHTHQLVDLLLKPSTTFTGAEFTDDLRHQLFRGGFLIATGTNEVEAVRERYWRARGETPVVLTITTTMECNLGCYYCYEERTPDSLGFRDVGAIVDLARQRITESAQRSLHVDWYGGEPLLNLEFIDEASRALQALCKQEKVRYVASIISNGSAWPSDVKGFVARNCIRQVQISFDGLKANHDRRRRFRKGYGRAGVSSFSCAVELVDKLVQCTRVDLRYNIDRGNRGDLLQFICFARERGWFTGPFPAVFQPARLAAYSDSSSFMRNYELSLEEFDALRGDVRREIGSDARIEESEVPAGFPYPKTSVCAALARHSVVIGAEGLTYRCGLQVGEKKRAVGVLTGNASTRTSRVDSGTDAGWWDAFDPTELPSCSQCSFLPICWGGCPKKHLEGDQHAVQEQGRYWRNNLLRLVAVEASIEDLQDVTIPEALQFRGMGRET